MNLVQLAKLTEAIKEVSAFSGDFARVPTGTADGDSDVLVTLYGRDQAGVRIRWEFVIQPDGTRVDR